jgi:hypothetical protein
MLHIGKIYIKVTALLQTELFSTKSWRQDDRISNSPLLKINHQLRDRDDLYLVAIGFPVFILKKNPHGAALD